MKVNFFAESHLQNDGDPSTAVYLASQISGRIEYKFSDEAESFLYEGPGVIIILNELNAFLDECLKFEGRWVNLQAMFSTIAVGRFIDEKLIIFIVRPNSANVQPMDQMNKEELTSLKNYVQKKCEKFGLISRS